MWYKLKAKDVLYILLFINIHIFLMRFIGKTSFYPMDKIPLFLMFFIVFFGLQEIFWVNYVYEYFLPKKGVYKSFAIVGLLKSLIFFPLSLFPVSNIPPNSLAYLAVTLIGMSGISVFLKKYLDSILSSVLFTGVTYSLMYFMDLDLGLPLVLVGFIEGIIIYALGEKMS